VFADIMSEIQSILWRFKCRMVLFHLLFLFSVLITELSQCFKL